MIIGGQHESVAGAELVQLERATTQSRATRQDDRPVTEQHAEALVERGKDVIHRRELALVEARERTGERRVIRTVEARSVVGEARSGNSRMNGQPRP
jgi:hypothetical protein